MPDLESLLLRLMNHDVEFVIAGGFAAAAHGCTLVTMDIDIACRMTTDNLQKLQQALHGLNPVHRMTPDRVPLDLKASDCEGLKNLYLDTNLGQLDCLSEIAGIGDFDAVKKMSEEIDLGSRKCAILTLDGIIQAKQAMDRPRDREALRQLKAIRERHAE
jgi:hypothetical protein